MNTYIITYDLLKPGQNYTKLISLIQKYDYFAKITESCYIINTEETPVQIRDYLKGAVDNNDKIFVGLIKAPAAWAGMANNVSNWLVNNLK